MDDTEEKVEPDWFINGLICRPLIVVGGSCDTDQENMGGFQEFPQVGASPHGLRLLLWKGFVARTFEGSGKYIITISWGFCCCGMILWPTPLETQVNSSLPPTEACVVAAGGSCAQDQTMGVSWGKYVITMDWDHIVVAGGSCKQDLERH